MTIAVVRTERRRAIVRGMFGLAVGLVLWVHAGCATESKAQETKAKEPKVPEAASDAGPREVVYQPPAPTDPQEFMEQDRLMEALRALPRRRSPNADQEHADGLLAAEALLVSRLEAMGIKPRLEAVRWAPPIRPSAENQRPEPREWNNIIVDFPGTGTVTDLIVPGAASDTSRNGVAFREVIVVAAHFDAVPTAPGADDNGSGTAALMEMARAFQLMRNAGWTTDKTIRLIFFNLEEVGLVGSKHHVSQWVLQNKERVERAKKMLDDRLAGKQSGDDYLDLATPGTVTTTKVKPTASIDLPERISLMLSLDTIGYFSDEEGSQKSPFKAIPGVFEPPTVGDAIALVTISAHKDACGRLARGMIKAAPGLKVFRADFSPLPLPDLLRSDHAPFLALGTPSIMVSDTANFRNPNYHKPTDTIETLDPRRLTLVAKGIAGAVWEMAGARASK